ncbi:MAG: AbrB/MazE/SpoVT family DNA-binding domain-containing protein [Calditrichaeota bacterium]|nr:AbrB/MazE/SpoVT family DNA-binding domain-containing protein [Calditrichota bacterium]
MSQTIQIRKKGNLTIPMEIRKKYQLEEGDPVTLIDTGEGIFLSPKRSLLPKLVAEIEALREKHNVSLEDLISGVNALRVNTNE